MNEEKCLHCGGELEEKFDFNKIIWYTYYYCDACMASGYDKDTNEEGE